MAFYTKRVLSIKQQLLSHMLPSSPKKGVSAYIHDCAHLSMSSTSCLFSILASCSGVCRRESF